jgi:hypothetical protein
MSEAPKRAMADGLTRHITRFQNRARLYFLTSYIILLVVFLLSAFAVYVFVFAQQIDRSRGSVELFHELGITIKNQGLIINSAQVEADGIKEEIRVGQRTTAELLDALKFLGDSKTKLGVLEEKQQLMLRSGYLSDIDTIKSKEEFEAQHKGLVALQATLKDQLLMTKKRFGVGEVTKTDVAQAEKAMRDIDSKLEINEARMRVAPAAATIKVTAENIDTIELIRTSLIRFGGVTVILFLASVLIPVYRYNVRLGTFYLARADTLILVRDSKIDNFSELIRLLTPSYEFDKEPTTPIESLSSLVKDAVGAAARKV